MQKSEVNKWISDRISDLCVFWYLTVGNISFDVLGPWAFQKYIIIRF